MLTILLKHVEPAVQKDAVVHECKRSLRPRTDQARDTSREIRLAVRADERADALELLSADARIPAAHTLDQIIGRQRSLQADDLEETVDGIADLRCGQSRRPGRRTALVGRTHAGDPF